MREGGLGSWVGYRGAAPHGALPAVRPGSRRPPRPRHAGGLQSPAGADSGRGRQRAPAKLSGMSDRRSDVHDSDHPSQRIIERFRSRRKELDTAIVAMYWNGEGVATEDFIDPLRCRAGRTDPGDYAAGVTRQEHRDPAPRTGIMAQFPPCTATVRLAVYCKATVLPCLEIGVFAAGRTLAQGSDAGERFLEVPFELFPMLYARFGIPQPLQQITLFSIEHTYFPAVATNFSQLILNFPPFLRQGFQALPSLGQTILDFLLRHLAWSRHPYHDPAGIVPLVEPWRAVQLRFREGPQGGRVREHSGNERRPPDRSGDPLDAVEGERRNAYEVDGAGCPWAGGVADTGKRVMRRPTGNGRVKNDGPVSCDRGRLYQWRHARRHGFPCPCVLEHVDQGNEPHENAVVVHEGGGAGRFPFDLAGMRPTASRASSSGLQSAKARATALDRLSPSRAAPG